jgi:hypothetical protein
MIVPLLVTKQGFQRQGGYGDGEMRETRETREMLEVEVISYPSSLS